MKSYKKLPYLSDLCLLAAVMVIYGCASPKDKAQDWDKMNYAKVICDSGYGDETKCKTNESVVTAIGVGKR